MNFSRIDLLRNLLEGRLSREVDAVLEALFHGFNVAIRSDDSELLELVKGIVEEVQDRMPGKFEVVCGSEFPRQKGELPVVLLGGEQVPSGAGFVPFQLPALAVLLPPWGSLVMKILEHFRQEAFVDAFDGKVMGLLRELLQKRGLSALIDAVMFVAYTAGAAGDGDRAMQGLREALEEEPESEVLPSSPVSPREPSAGSLSSHAEAFFQGMLARNEPAHLCTKAALSLYVVRGMGYSISEASRLLKVSRTTIQDHLRLARELGLEGFFGARVRPSREGLFLRA